MPRALSAVVVDDEPLARAHLCYLLREQEVTITGEAATAAEAVQMIQDTAPNVLFLDIQMPGIDGMQASPLLVAGANAPLLVFVTGFDQYALQAWERSATDYLLKPVSRDRLAKTLERVRQRLAERVLSPAVDLPVPPASPPPAAPRVVPVRGDYALILLPVESIVYAEAASKRVWIIDADGSRHRATQTLTELADFLPAEQFFRLHDSYLVNMSAVAELNFLGNHAYSVRLRTGQSLPVGRTRYPELRRRLGLP